MPQIRKKFNRSRKRTDKISNFVDAYQRQRKQGNNGGKKRTVFDQYLRVRQEL